MYDFVFCAISKYLITITYIWFAPEITKSERAPGSWNRSFRSAPLLLNTPADVGGAKIGRHSLCTGRSGSSDSNTTKDKKLRGESERGGRKNTFRLSLH